MTAVLDIHGLTRRFGSVLANDDVSLTVRPGQVVGLLGHNGAGKTTLVSQVVGLLRPDAGTISVAGVDAVADPAAARRGVALQAQAQAPIDGLTPRSAITIAGRLRGLSRRDAAAAAERLADELDIGEWSDRRATPDGGGLSGGVRRLTSFAMAAAAPAPLVVLDEPTNVVDAARVVDELVILDRGRVVASGTPAQLRGTTDRELRLELSLHPGGGDPSIDTAPAGVTMTRRV